MPIPAIVGAAAAIAAHGAGSAFLGPWIREASYAANRAGPTGVPTLEALQNLWWSGRISMGTFRSGLENHGIAYWDPDWPGTRPVSTIGTWPDAWKQVVELGRPMHSIGDYRKWWRQGRMGVGDDFGPPQQYKDFMARQGFTHVSLGIGKPSNKINYDLFTDDFDTWDFTTALDLYHRGIISWGDLLYYLKIVGFFRQDEIDAVAEMYPVPTIRDCHILRNRDVIDPATYNNWLTKNGLRNVEVRKATMELRKEIPGSSDLIRFALREAWDPAVVSRYGYDADFPPEVAYWMEKQGYNWSEPITKPDGTVIPGVPWPILYWRAHWQAVSPTQSYTFLHRFRPDNIAKWQAKFKGIQPFLAQNVYDVLKIADYPLGFRQYLAAASYKVISRVDIRRFHQQGTFVDSDLPSRYMDLGYTEEDAKSQAEFTVNQNALQRVKAEMSGLRSKVIAAYKAGTINRDKAGGMLAFLGITSGKEMERVRQLTETERIDLGRNRPYVQLILSGVDADVEQQVAKQSINAVKKAYLRLELTPDQATLQLRAIGIVDDRIAQYLRLWAFQLLGRGKAPTAAQLMRWVVRGVILPDTARDRLMLLGYTLLDANTMIALAIQDHDMAVAKAQIAAAKSAKEAELGFTSQVQAVQRLLRQYQADLAKHGTPVQLADWLARDLIGRPEYDMRMAALGWPASDAQHLADKAAGAPKVGT